MSRGRRRNPFVIAFGTVVILGLGIYGPAVLVGPLPAARVTVDTPAAAGRTSSPVLPTTGASAIATTPDQPVVQTAGTKDPVPLAGVTKIVTALVVLSAKPVRVGEDGPTITMTAADAALYAAHVQAGDRSIVVVAGERWTERQMLEAVVLDSSNNHADSLADWAFGSQDAFLAAAKSWLAQKHLGGIHLADATGLSEDSVGTAADATTIAAIAHADPTLADILTNPVTTLANERAVDNTTVYRPELGIAGISRSFTDAAGVCFLFSASVTIDGKPFTFVGALLQQPDYDTVDVALTALMKDARTSVHAIHLVSPGDRFATITTPWGQTAHAVASTTQSVIGWSAAKPEYRVSVPSPLRTASAGRTIGDVTVSGAGKRSIAELTLDRSLNDPGLGWRVLNPVPVIGALIASLQPGR